jgi:hypothetical protein
MVLLFTTVVIAATIISLLAIFALIAITKQSAFGDGLTQEQLTASLGNRKADLLIKMNPPVVTTETLQNGQKPIVEFRLFDPTTNRTFNHVTYYITLQKDGKRLFFEWFHSHQGDLVIKVDPNTKNKTITVDGEQDPIQYTYMGTLANPAVVSGPIFLEGGLYHFIVKIYTVDNDEAYLPIDQQPVYDSWLSIGYTENRQISIGDQDIPVKVISYYDKLSDFEFDNKNMQVKFDMPFNWNISRINKTSIFVHEEVTVPKANTFTTKGSFIGKVNGIDISKDVMVDNTNPEKDVIHVMIPKNNLIQLADQVNKNGQASTGLMQFTLQPGGGVRGMPSGSMEGGMSMPMLSMGVVSSGK